jgi:hypothetical protein
MAFFGGSEIAEQISRESGGFESLVQYLSLIFKDFMVFRSAIESACLKERRSHRTNACATLCSGSVAELALLTNRNSKGVVTSVVASEKNLSPWNAAQLVAHAPAFRDIPSEQFTRRPP